MCVRARACGGCRAFGACACVRRRLLSPGAAGTVCGFPRPAPAPLARPRRWAALACPPPPGADAARVCDTLRRLAAAAAARMRQAALARPTRSERGLARRCLLPAIGGAAAGSGRVPRGNAAGCLPQLGADSVRPLRAGWGLQPGVICRQDAPPCCLRAGDEPVPGAGRAEDGAFGATAFRSVWPLAHCPLRHPDLVAKGCTPTHTQPHPSAGHWARQPLVRAQPSQSRNVGNSAGEHEPLDRNPPAAGRPRTDASAARPHYASSWDQRPSSRPQSRLLPRSPQILPRAATGPPQPPLHRLSTVASNITRACTTGQRPPSARASARQLIRGSLSRVTRPCKAPARRRPAESRPSHGRPRAQL